MNRLVLFVLQAALVSGCALFEPADDLPPLDRDTAADHVVRAEQDLSEGKSQRALDRLLDVQAVNDLPTAERHRVKLLVESTAFRLLEELAVGDDPADDLEDLFEEDVPVRVRVSAGVASARQLLLDGEPLEAYEMIRRVDEAFPTHHERAAAGALVADAGFQLERSEDTYFFFFDYRDRAPEVLEYLVLNYPSNVRCEDAYLMLASLYEKDGEWRVAQERHEDVLLYYPGSVHVPYSEARIPELRMRQVVGPEYDRTELLRAGRELERWLSRHRGGPETPNVEADLARCKRLLIDSDLTVARFYRRVDQDFGVRLHADRARDLAQKVGDADRLARALDLLASYEREPERADRSGTSSEPSAAQADGATP